MTVREHSARLAAYPRPSHPAPRIVTTRFAPHAGGMTSLNHNSRLTESRIFFRRALDSSGKTGGGFCSVARRAKQVVRGSPRQGRQAGHSTRALYFRSWMRMSASSREVTIPIRRAPALRRSGVSTRPAAPSWAVPSRRPAGSCSQLRGRRFARAEHPVLQAVEAIVRDAEKQEIPAPARARRLCARGKGGHGFTLCPSPGSTSRLPARSKGRAPALPHRNVADAWNVSCLCGTQARSRVSARQLIQLDDPFPAVRCECPHEGERHSTIFHGNLRLEVNHCVGRPVPRRFHRAITCEGVRLTYDTDGADTFRHSSGMA